MNALGWRNVALEDVADELTVGYVGPMATEYVDVGVPFLRSLNVEPLRINNNELKFVTPEFHQRIQKSRLVPGDVVIVRTGKPGACSVVPDWLADANCSDLVIVRCGKQLNNRFLAYYINTVASQHVAAHLVGAVQQHFNVGSARTMRINLPPLAEQKNIACILGTLDDKIELNRRMNKTLEEMARALFRSWFVDFDPVRAKMAGRKPTNLDPATAALFPDSFQESELGPIPKEWDVKTIEGVCKTVTRGVTPDYEVGSGRFIINQRVNRGSDLDWSSLKELSPKVEVPSDRFAKCWDVLVNSLGEGTLGRIHLFKGESNIYAVDQHMSICRADLPERATYLYEVLTSAEGQTKIERMKTGSTGMTMLNISRLRSFEMVWPSSALLDAYFRLVEPLWLRIGQNEHHSHTLAALRDTLLPKLLSGELRVTGNTG